MKTKSINTAKQFGPTGAGTASAVISVLALMMFPALLPPHATRADLLQTAGVVAFALTGWLLPCAIAVSQRKMKTLQVGNRNVHAHGNGLVLAQNIVRAGLGSGLEWIP
jgi:hypothetical protein